MNRITHGQAQRFLRAELDGLLHDEQRRDLEAHLRDCAACRADAQALSELTSRLQSGFRARWDAQDGPSPIVMANVHSQTRRILMSNRINFGLRALASVGALLLFGLFVNFVVSQVRANSAATTGRNTIEGIPSESPLPAEKRLIAFASEKDGNPDIYIMYPDGSGLTNLTKNPASDTSPFWSPDGKRIAFLSNRNDPAALSQLFVMNADGSDVTQLTNNEANHEFNVDDSSPWSPDGTKLLFTEWIPGDEKWMLYSIDIDGQNKIALTDIPDNYAYTSWSPDGKHIAFIKTKSQAGPQQREVLRIYVVDSNGQNLVESTKLVPPDEDLFPWDYSWSDDGQSIFFITYRYHYENENGRSAFYQAGLDGNSLSEVDHVTTTTLVGAWWDGTSLITNMGTSMPLTWLRPDGTHSTLNVYKYCEVSNIDHGFVYERSSEGNLLIGAGCYNDDWWFHWANPDGTMIQQLLNYPIYVKDGSVDMTWSPDGQYVALSTISSDIAFLYVVNVADALRDPSTQLIKVEIGKYAGTSVSWQPLP